MIWGTGCAHEVLTPRPLRAPACSLPCRDLTNDSEARVHNPSPPGAPAEPSKSPARVTSALRLVLRAACSQARLPRCCHQEYIDFINPLLVACKPCTHLWEQPCGGPSRWQGSCTTCSRVHKSLHTLNSNPLLVACKPCTHLWEQPCGGPSWWQGSCTTCSRVHKSLHTLNI